MSGETRLKLTGEDFTACAVDGNEVAFFEGAA